MIDYGAVVMNNFSKEQGQNISKVVAFFVMPKYNLSLE